MRNTFHSDMRALTDAVGVMVTAVGDAMATATRALLDADLMLAEQVIERDWSIDVMRSSCEEKAYLLLVLQAPVAGDMRTIVAFIHAAEKLERMGDLARHVAEQARRRHPEHAMPEETRDRFATMGELAVNAAREVADLIANPDRTGFMALHNADDLIDTLEQSLLASVSDGRWRHGVRAGIDVALLARFYERFADHAVSVARRLDYAATGELPPTPPS